MQGMFTLLMCILVGRGPFRIPEKEPLLNDEGTKYFENLFC